MAIHKAIDVNRSAADCIVADVSLATQLLLFFAPTKIYKGTNSQARVPIAVQLHWRREDRDNIWAVPLCIPRPRINQEHVPIYTGITRSRQTEAFIAAPGGTI